MSAPSRRSASVDLCGGRCPVLLLWGEEDRLVPPAYGKAYQQHLPQAVWKTIPSCGHLAMFEKEAEFVREVLAFCQDGA